MKRNRAWLSLVAAVVLATFVAPAAHAILLCDDVCSCFVPCTRKCTPTPPLPTVSCGYWGYECIGDPICSGLARTASSTGEKAAAVTLEQLFAADPAAESTDAPAAR